MRHEVTFRLPAGQNAWWQRFVDDLEEEEALIETSPAEGYPRGTLTILVECDEARLQEIKDQLRNNGAEII